MKRSEIYFSVAQVPVDFFMVLLAAATAFYLRSLPMLEGYVSRVFNLTFEQYIQFAALLSPLLIVAYAFEGLYAMRATRSFWREAFRVFQASSVALLIVIIAIFLQREWFSSRFIILVGWVFIVLYVSIGRFLLVRLQKHYLVKKGVGVHRVLLVGTNGKIDALKKLFRKNPELGYKVVDQVENISVHHIKLIRDRKGIDEIIVCDPSLTDDEQEKLIDYCEINNIVYKYMPTTMQTSRFAMSIFNGEPMIEFMHTPLDGWGKVLKRSFDLVAGSLLTLIALPIMGVIALLIKLEDSAGPIVYKNERIGENGQKFYVYKFRYMLWKWCINKNNPNFDEALKYEQELIKERSLREGPLYKIKDDPRKTRVGAVIERYSLDELPQFFNVLQGTMSLVGPRPHQKREVEKYHEYHRRLLTIKPGITGMAQVSGRSDLDFEDEYRLDVFYIENWSLWLDIIICFKTAGALLRRRKN